MAHERILIVDDDPDIIEAMSLILEAQGFQVAAASSGAEALGAIPRVNPDLIILDVMMETDTEGFHLAYSVRNPAPDAPYAAHAKTPILMLTAISQRTGMHFDPSKDEAFLPVDDFVEKPIKPETLIAKVRGLLKT